MNIYETKFSWNGSLASRGATDYIILHHSAGTGDVLQVHQAHLNNGWAGIGYHFYVRQDGSVFKGRPVSTVGAHTVGFNSQSVGVCFEGNFETASMKSAQLKAGKELIRYLKDMYPGAKIKKHKDFSKTACPGKNFPFDELIKENNGTKELESVNDIVWQLNHRGIITNTKLWLEKLSEDENAYWLARKTANMTVNKEVG